MKKLLAALTAVCLIAVPTAAANAGILALFGDVNSMSDNTSGRNQILFNLLGSGTKVIESKQNSEFPEYSGISDYYSSLSGVTSSVSSANIDAASLSGVNLLFLNIGCCYNTWSNPYSASEISAMAGFLQSGGNIGILQEPCCTDTAAVIGMNAMLASLGSTMMFTEWVGNGGTATILPGALSAGVTGYQPNTFGAIAGGNAVAVVGGRTAVAYDVIAEQVPEPAMLGLFGLGAIGLGLARRRRAA